MLRVFSAAHIPRIFHLPTSMTATIPRMQLPAIRRVSRMHMHLHMQPLSGRDMHMHPWSHHRMRMHMQVALGCSSSSMGLTASLTSGSTIAMTNTLTNWSALLYGWGTCRAVCHTSSAPPIRGQLSHPRPHLPPEAACHTCRDRMPYLPRSYVGLTEVASRAGDVPQARTQPPCSVVLV